MAHGLAELSWLEQTRIVQRVNPGQPAHISPKDFNTEDFVLSNKLYKAKKCHFSATMRMLLSKRDLEIYRVESFPDFTSGL